MQTANSPASKSKTRAADRLALALACGLALVALAGIAASAISLQTFLRVALGSSQEDQVLRGVGTIAQTFGSITRRLRFFSVAMMSAAVVLFLFRRYLSIWIEEVVFPAPRFVREAITSSVHTLKADELSHKLMFAALCVIGCAIRLRLLFQPIRFDEADTFITFASRPLAVALSWYSEPNNHLFNTLLIHIASRMLGDSEWVLRLPAFCAGCLLIPLTYWAARVLYNKYAALIAASLVATAQHLIDLSVQSRGYTLQCDFFLLVLILSAWLLDRDDRPAWLFWIVFATLGFYSVPTLLYGFVTAALWLGVNYFLISTPPPVRVDRMAYLGAAIGITAALTILLYSPILIATGWNGIVSDRFLVSRTYSFVISRSPTLIEQIWAMWTAKVPAALIGVLTLGFAAAIVGHRRIARYPFPILAPLFLSAPPMLLAQRVLPIARVWIYFLPLFAAVSAAGVWLLLLAVGRVRKEHVSLVSAAATLVFVGLTIIPDLRGSRLPRPTLEGAEQNAAWLKTHVTQGDVLLIKNSLRPPIMYYFRRQGVRLFNRPAPCDPQAIAVFASQAHFAKGAAFEPERLFMLIYSGEEWRNTYGACIAGAGSAVPALVHTDGALRILENSPVLGQQRAMLGIR